MADEAVDRLAWDTPQRGEMSELETSRHAEHGGMLMLAWVIICAVMALGALVVGFFLGSCT